MEFNPNRLGQAFSLTMGIVYLICAAAVAAVPDFAMKMFGWLVHLVNLEKVSEISVSLGGTIAGLVLIMLYSYLGGYLFGWLYNKLGKGGTAPKQ